MRSWKGLIFAGALTVSGVLVANSTDRLEVDDKTWAAFSEWSDEAQPQKDDGANLGLLHDDNKSITEIMPGMSELSIDLDVALRKLMVATFKKDIYHLSREAEIKVRWEMLEFELLEVPSDLSPQNKLSAFLSAATKLGDVEFKELAEAQGIKAEMPRRLLAYNFFFMSDAKRLEMLNNVSGGTSSSSGLPDILYNGLKTEKQFDRKIRADDDTLKAFAKWVVEEVYQKIPEDSRQEQIELLLENKKELSSMSSAINKKTQEKFKITMNMTLLVEILAYVADKDS